MCTLDHVVRRRSTRMPNVGPSEMQILSNLFTRCSTNLKQPADLLSIKCMPPLPTMLYFARHSQLLFESICTSVCPSNPSFLFSVMEGPERRSLHIQSMQFSCKMRIIVPYFFLKKYIPIHINLNKNQFANWIIF